MIARGADETLALLRVRLRQELVVLVLADIDASGTSSSTTRRNCRISGNARFRRAALAHDPGRNRPWFRRVVLSYQS